MLLLSRTMKPELRKDETICVPLAGNCRDKIVPIVEVLDRSSGVKQSEKHEQEKLHNNCRQGIQQCLEVRHGHPSKPNTGIEKSIHANNFHVQGREGCGAT